MFEVDGRGRQSGSRGMKRHISPGTCVCSQSERYLFLDSAREAIVLIVFAVQDLS